MKTAVAMLAILLALASDLLWGTGAWAYVVHAGSGTVFMTAVLSLIHENYRAPGRRGRFARSHPAMFMTCAALVVITLFATVVFLS